MMTASRTILVLALLVLGLPAQSPPNRVLVGYWHNWGYSPNNLTLAQLPAEYDVINVSFAIPTAPGGSTMTFAPDPQLYPNPATFDTDIQALQALGKKVLISIGGATGPVYLDTAADVAAFVSSMQAIIAAHGFDGMDIDLEGSSLLVAAGDTDFTNPSSPRIVNFISAVNCYINLLLFVKCNYGNI